jgi:WD40 repeat protein
MIFPRSRDVGNAAPARRRLGGIALTMAGLLGLIGCASTPRIPANVILHDAHNNGYALAFDAESKTLASGGSEGRIRLWSLPEGKELAGWKAHASSLQGLQFLNRDRNILSAGYDGVLARWTLEGKLLQRRATPSPITDILADETAALVVTGHRDGHVRLWRMGDLSPLHDLPLHRGAVRAVAYHPATRQVASSGTDGQVFHWTVGGHARALPSPSTDAQDLAFTPDGDFLVGSGWFKLFRWRLADAALTILPTAHTGIVKSISFSGDGRQLASIGRQTDSAVYLLDAQTGDVRQRFQPHELCGTAVLLSPDGRYLASTSDDANVHIWDLRNPLPERSFYNNGSTDKHR